MEYGVLGPLQVNGEDIALPGKQRVLLVVLLLHANRVVPVDALIDALWDDAPPSSARTTTQGYVKQLRQYLGVPAGERLITRSPGYLMALDAGELDLHRFTGLCDQARSAARRGDWAGAAGQLREALALWRGDPLAGVPSAVLQRTEVPRLAELRMHAVESRIEAELNLGRHADMVAELRGLTSGEPLRESLHAQLMLALYRCGRQAEALEVFRGIDRRLRDELGLSPGLELRQLHERILRTDPALAVGGAPAADVRLGSVTEVPGAPPAAFSTSPAPASLPLVPAQLPPDTADFTGREEQVKILYDLLAAPPDQERPGAVLIAAIAGMGGIGKTALATHVAHRLRERFPDGQLFVSLQGATSPLCPAEVLARLLRDIGDLDEVMPVAEAERAARYRSLLAGQRMLIVLDNARDAAQVRPLLPGSAGCAVIVTSRRALTGLAGATQFNLHALGPCESRDLFTAIVGAPRTAAEPDAVSALLTSCAGLPLAVRIAASRLASRPGWSIAHLAAKLADERDRLSELATGDLAVRASFAVSYDALRAGQPSDEDGVNPARVFRLLGLPDAAELSLPAIAALAGQPPAQVAGALETLADAHLIESSAPDRYRLHDLLRSYAAELGRHTESQDERDVALSRMLHWYARQVVVMVRVLAPRRVLPMVIPVPDAQAPMTGPAQAFDWFEAELSNLTVAVSQAADLRRHDIAAQIAMAMLDFFQRTPHIEVWLSVGLAGADSARRLGNDAALSYLLVSLGQARGEMRRFADADRYFFEALQIRSRTGDKTGQAIAMNCLGVSLIRQGRHESALDYLRQALDILVAVGDRRITGTVLNNIGDALWYLRRYDESVHHLERALAIRQEMGDGFRTSTTETTLGQVYLDMGRYEEAVEHCQRALTTLQGIAYDNRSRANALSTLGGALIRLGRCEQAREAWLTALPILDRLNDPEAAELRHRLAETGCH